MHSGWVSAGWVWADTLSGWFMANSTLQGTGEDLEGPPHNGNCIVAPSNEPMVLRLMPLANATATAKAMAAEEAKADEAWGSDYKYV